MQICRRIRKCMIMHMHTHMLSHLLIHVCMPACTRMHACSCMLSMHAFVHAGTRAFRHPCACNLHSTMLKPLPGSRSALQSPLTVTPPSPQLIDAKSASNESITLTNRWNSGKCCLGGFISLRIGRVLLIRGDPNLKIHGQSSGLDFGRFCSGFFLVNRGVY